MRLDYPNGGDGIGVLGVIAFFVSGFRTIRLNFC